MIIEKISAPCQNPEGVTGRPAGWECKNIIATKNPHKTPKGWNDYRKNISTLPKPRRGDSITGHVWIT